jgi:hypothetical protein
LQLLERPKEKKTIKFSWSFEDLNPHRIPLQSRKRSPKKPGGF